MAADQSASPATSPVARRNDLPTWWRDAVVYQIYPRSFADANGDGVGDIAGIRGKLPYLASLGIDAVWISPWYSSPMKDAGYDVSDYRDIEPVFGTLAEAGAMITAARRGPAPPTPTAPRAAGTCTCSPPSSPT